MYLPLAIHFIMKLQARENQYSKKVSNKSLKLFLEISNQTFSYRTLLFGITLSTNRRKANQNLDQ